MTTSTGSSRQAHARTLRKGNAPWQCGPVAIRDRWFAALAAFGLLVAQSARAQTPVNPTVPAFLPMASAVPKTQPLAVDGTWTITSIGKRIRIEAGRAYAVDPWVHMFVLQIQPGMVVLEDLRSTSPGHYVGKDLPLMGQLKADLTPDGNLNVTVAGAFGPANYQLAPVEIDDRPWFARARSGEPRLPAAGAPAPNQPYVKNPPAAGQAGSPAAGQAGSPAASDAQVWAAGKYPGVIPPEPVEPQEAPQPGKTMLPEKAAPVRVGPATSLGCGTLNDQLYFSLRNGGECWSCPHGYARDPGALVTSGHACAKRNSLGIGKFVQGPFRPATFVRTAYGCGAGLFRIGKECMKCPDGYKRQDVLGLADSCKRISSRDQVLVQESKRIAPLMSGSIKQMNEIRSCFAKPDMIRQMADALKRRDGAAAARVRDSCAPPAKLQALRRIPPGVLGGSGKDQKPQFFNAFTYSITGSAMVGAGVGVTVGISWDLSGTNRGSRFFTAGEGDFGLGLGASIDVVQLGWSRSLVPTKAEAQRGVSVGFAGDAWAGGGVSFDYLRERSNLEFVGPAAILADTFDGLTVSGGIGVSGEIAMAHNTLTLYW